MTASVKTANFADRQQRAEHVDVVVSAKGQSLIKLGQDRCWATSTPHQPANAGFALGLRLNVGECG